MAKRGGKTGARTPAKKPKDADDALEQTTVTPDNDNNAGKSKSPMKNKKKTWTLVVDCDGNTMEFDNENDLKAHTE